MGFLDALLVPLEGPQQNNVHFYHFRIFEPMEQKLSNLKQFLSLEINQIFLKVCFSLLTLKLNSF
jgi:hypothetical protein